MQVSIVLSLSIPGYFLIASSLISLLPWVKRIWGSYFIHMALDNEEASHKERHRRRSRESFCLLESLVLKLVRLELVLSSTS